MDISGGFDCMPWPLIITLKFFLGRVNKVEEKLEENLTWGGCIFEYLTCVQNVQTYSMSVSHRALHIVAALAIEWACRMRQLPPPAAACANKRAGKIDGDSRMTCRHTQKKLLLQHVHTWCLEYARAPPACLLISRQDEKPNTIHCLTHRYSMFQGPDPAPQAGSRPQNKRIHMIRTTTFARPRRPSKPPRCTRLGGGRKK